MHKIKLYLLRLLGQKYDQGNTCLSFRE
jgi:hypothetical protein